MKTIEQMRKDWDTVLDKFTPTATLEALAKEYGVAKGGRTKMINGLNDTLRSNINKLKMQATEK